MNGSFMVVLLAIVLFSSTARANPWPAAAVEDYGAACITVHKDRWPGVSEDKLTALCVCKVKRLAVLSTWEEFAPAYEQVKPVYMEKFVALPRGDQASIMKDLDASAKLALLRVIRAEDDCAKQN